MTSARSERTRVSVTSIASTRAAATNVRISSARGTTSYKQGMHNTV